MNMISRETTQTDLTIIQNNLTSILLSSGNYNSKIRYINLNVKINQVLNHKLIYRPNTKVLVGLKLSLLKLISIDEVQGIMHSSAYLFAVWFDPRLVWEPKDYGGISELPILTSQLWIPDFYIINSADSSGSVNINGKSLAYVNYFGLIVINIDLLGKNCLFHFF